MLLSSSDTARFFDASPNPYLVLDRRLHIAAANRAYLEATGRELDDIVGRWAWDAFPTDPDTLAQATASLERVIATKRLDTMGLLRFDIPRYAEQGGSEERYWSLTHAPVLGDDGEVAYVIQHALDVTEVERLRGSMGVAGTDRLKPAHAGIFDRADSVHRANLSLIAEGERLRALFQKAPGFISVLAGPEHVYEFANEAYQRLVGGRDLAGLPVREALPDIAAQGFFELLDRVYATGERFVAEAASIRLRNASDDAEEERFLDFIYEAIRDAEGAVAGIFVEGQDVTERVRADTRLRESEARLRALAEASSDVLYRMNPDWTEMRELEGGGFLSDTTEPSRAWLMDYIPPEDRASVSSAIDAAICTKSVFVLEHGVRRADGTTGWTLSRAVPIIRGDGEIVEWFGAASDVTARREAEERLLQSDERSRRIVQGLKDYSVFTTDLQGCVVDWTPGAEAVFGWRTEEIMGVESAILFTPEDREAGVPAQELAEAHRTGCANDERWHVRKDGTRFFANGSVRPLHDAAGAVAGFMKVARDETERRAADKALRDLNETLEHRVADELASRMKAEDQLRQAQKMEAIGQLTGGVAHDFNNLLTIIRSSADLLRRQELPDEKRRRYVDAISDTADRAARLTAQLLAFARRQALKPEVFDATERVRSVADMLRTVLGARVSLTIEAKCAPCLVDADPGQFETALVNLGVNARDAMDGEGRLTVIVGNARELPPLRGHAGSPGKFATITVSDTGSGIAPDNLARIFEPFFTTKEVGKGTGLGLSQVFGFAKQSGGEVEVKSELGKGTSFTLYLPHAENAPTASVADAPELTEERRGRVLVVEDNTQVGEFAVQLLEDRGYRPELAGNASEAIRSLEDEHGRFDLVFSDVVMPGMGGVELGRIVRDRWPELPVVLTSGYSHVLAEDARHGFPLLHKPYSVEELARVLRRAAAEAQGGRRERSLDQSPAPEVRDL